MKPLQIDKVPNDKMVIYVDMDGTLVDFEKAHKARQKDNPLVGYPQSEYGFFENLEPLPNAIETVKALQESELYEVFILTAPSEKNPLCYTEKRNSIEKLLGFDWLERLIISPIKSIYKGDYLIDDHVGKGQEHFEGLHMHFGKEKFPDWDSVRKFLLPNIPHKDDCVYYAEFKVCPNCGSPRSDTQPESGTHAYTTGFVCGFETTTAITMGNSTIVSKDCSAF